MTGDVATDNGVVMTLEVERGRSASVIVTEVVEETHDSRSLVVSPAADEADRFGYRPGQFLTIRVPDRGRGTARCYSLSSSPHRDEVLKVTVKRVADGAASNWICDEVGVGDVLEVLPPTGVFTPKSLDESVVLVAGGSGITPVISIAKSVLFAGTAEVMVIYANRDERSVIFGAELRELEQQFGDRLTVVHILESVQGYPSRALLDSLISPLREREVFVCGPAPLMDLVTEVAKAAGVSRQRIHSERFVSLGGDPFAVVPDPVADPAGADSAGADSAGADSAGTDATGGGEAADEAPTVSVTVELDGQTQVVPWRRSARLLDALLDAGVDAPYSCREGACSACVCTLRSGEVSMAANEVLAEEDIADGYILTCQAEAVSDEISIEY